MDGVQTATHSAQYLTFFVAGEEYGVEILRAREIHEFDTLTKVPTMPACVRGVINLRGSVVPVVDIAVKVGLPEIVPSRLTCVVILEVESEGERSTIGVLVDGVGQVIDLAGDDIQPPPVFGTRLRTDLLMGMGKKEKKFVLLLNVDRLLATDELLAATTTPPEGGASEVVDGDAGAAEGEPAVEPPA
jgi:purine-binding chemotaxis protein CheW